MPELPEVEVACRGIAPHVCNAPLIGARVRNAKLRRPVTTDLDAIAAGRRIDVVTRRGKYLLLNCAGNGGRPAGSFLIHLGMSGSLRWIPSIQADALPAGRHDHVDLLFATGTLRFNDPRRFGVFEWISAGDIARHPLLAPLGIEPLGEDFDGRWLQHAFARRSGPVKSVLMDAHTIVGIGNIYASESLFRAGISPLRAANRIAERRCVSLAEAVRDTLNAAIAAGGSSIRDYVHSDGGTGCFQVDCAVYERDGEPCRRCSGTVRRVRQSGRSTYYCPSCQH